MKHYLWSRGLFVLMGAIATTLNAQEITVESLSGEQLIVLEVNADEPIGSVMEKIKNSWEINSVEPDDLNAPIVFEGVITGNPEESENPFQNELWLSFMHPNSSKGIITVRAATLNAPRNYDAPLTNEDKTDISYIVKTLANKSLPRILREKGSLERAGDRIKPVHPFRFLMFVFTDEVLKVGIHNIKRKGGWVWKDFMGGLNDSLNEEFARQNLKPTYIAEFAAMVGIDQEIILPIIQEANWHEFLNTLITQIPRQGDVDRYDM